MLCIHPLTWNDLFTFCCNVENDPHFAPILAELDLNPYSSKAASSSLTRPWLKKLYSGYQILRKKNKQKKKANSRGPTNVNHVRVWEWLTDHSLCWLTDHHINSNPVLQKSTSKTAQYFQQKEHRTSLALFKPIPSQLKLHILLQGPRLNKG